MKFGKTQFVILIVMVSVAVFLSVLDVLSTDLPLARQWHYETLAVNFYDMLTETERQRLSDMWDRGVLTERQLPEIVDRFMRAPNRENALEQSFKTGFGANVGREWGDIKEVFLDPDIGIEAFKALYKEHNSAESIVHIAWHVLTSPVRTWGWILSGKGLGERPLGTLVWFIIGIVIIGKVAVRLARVIGPLIVPIPNIVWNFTLDRVREFGKAVRGEE